MLIKQSRMPVFTVERNAIEQQVRSERWGVSLLAGGAIAGLVLPVLMNWLPPTVKTTLLVGSVAGGIGFTASVQLRDRKEKIYQSFDKVQLEEFRSLFKHAAARNDVVQQIQAKNQLLSYILTAVPPEQQDYWIHYCGLQDLLPPLPTLAAEVPTSSLPEWANHTVDAQGIEYAVYDEPEASIDWLINLVKAALEQDPEKRRFHHAKIDGGSQSGKSTIVSKWLELFIKGLQAQGEKVIINLIDPKYPKTRWAIKPSFIGFEQVEEGVDSAIAELDERKRLTLEAEKKGQPHPNFPRYICILDEWDSVWNKGKGYGKIISKEKADSIRGEWLRLMKESAAYNFHCLLIGQSPLSEDAGFSRSSLNSTTRIIAGLEALKWAQDPGFPFKSQVEGLRSDLEYWLGRNHRCVLVTPTLGSPYVEGVPSMQIEMSSPKATTSPSKPTSQPQAKPTTDPYGAMLQWAKSLGHEPSDQEIYDRFLALTGQKLNKDAIAYVRQFILSKRDGLE